MNRKQRRATKAGSSPAGEVFHAKAIALVSGGQTNGQTLKDAVEAFSRAVALQPDNAEWHGDLGAALQSAGHYEDAIAASERAIALDPVCARAFYNRGLALKSLKRLEEAIISYRRALVVRPADPETHNNLGVIFADLFRPEEAEEAFRAVLALRADDPEAHNNLGVVLLTQGKFDDGTAACRRAIALRPFYAEARANIGTALFEQGRFNGAFTTAQQVLEIEPGYAAAENNRGVALQAMGRLAEATKAFRKALVLRPDFPEAHYNLGTTLLQDGKFLDGWREYEWRWKGGVESMVPRHFRQPRWAGEDLTGKTILLYAEQGLGDALQFVRYAAPIAARDGRVILEVYSPLARLLTSVPGLASVVAGGDALPDFDYHLPLMSAPGVLGTTLDSLPNDTPYITADARQVAAWKQRLAGLSGLRVGLAWSGDPRPHDPRANSVDRRRSIALARLTPLLSVPGVSFVSLQKGRPAAQLNEIAADGRPFDAMDQVGDFADTAALVANLDLIISVDTSIVHLAGAMGKPVWILSRFDGCWRWLTDRDDSPWYPTARLFRQTTPGDWSTVVERVAAELAHLSGQSGRGDLLSARPKTVTINRLASDDLDEAKRTELATPAKGARQPDERRAAALLRFPRAREHQQAGRLPEAEEFYRRILSDVPDHAASLYNLGLIVLQGDRPDEAADLMERALSQKTDDPQAYYNLGTAYHRAGEPGKAVDAYGRALALRPDYPEAGNNLGAALMDLRRIGAAEAAFRSAIALRPAYPQAHYNLGTALLLQGHLTEGWQEFEWRWQGGARCLTARAFLQPSWQGEDPAGKTILLYGEQGLGDMLQFARYATPLAARGARVILEVHRSLVRLLASVPGVADVVAMGDPLPDDIDFQLSLMSAPRVMETTLENIPATVPYVAGDTAQTAAWQERLAKLPGLKVGLAWAGEPRPGDPEANAIDRRRSLAIARMAPLLAIPGISFVSLQKGAAARQLHDLPSGRRPLDWMDEVTDFADTAALVANLDLVITVDTSVAHLAGAMGKPVWILSRFDGCWRWLLDRDDSPWYPTARLFRQRSAGAWQEVLAQVATELTKLAGKTASAPRPGQEATVSKTSSATSRLFDLALEHHRAGRLTEAAALYHRAIDADPNHARSHYNLGLIALQETDYRTAVETIRRALALDPGNAEAQTNLGTALQALNKLPEAIAAFRASIELRPDDARVHFNLATALDAVGKPKEAAAAYRAAIVLNPAFTEAYVNLATTVAAPGLDAIGLLRRAIVLSPEDAKIQYDLGMALQNRGENAMAEAAFQAILDRDPGHLKARGALEVLYIQMGRPTEAEAVCRAVIGDTPDNVPARSNLAAALFDQGRFGEALAAVKSAIVFQPDFACAYNGLAVTLQTLGQLAESSSAYRRCLSLDPNYAEARHNWATALLQNGDYAEGWREYEWRWQAGEGHMKPRDFSKPQWAGEDLNGRTILLHAEQGFGDVLQFARYATPLAAAGARVILEVFAPLKRLLASVPGAAQVVATGEALPNFDYHLPMMSAPDLLGTTLETIPADIPYITPDPRQISAWGERLAGFPGLKVGLVWAGNPRPGQPRAHLVDSRRSVALRRLMPVLSVPGVTFVSLQKDEPATQMLGIAPALRPQDWMKDVTDFADTAALVANLDLVIAVDTSIVHLAGALGKPVWILSRYDGCWRWLWDREDSPWYPTARLFRQSEPGNWDAVATRVAAELTRFAADRAAPASQPSPLDESDSRRAGGCHHANETFGLARVGGIGTKAQATPESPAEWLVRAIEHHKAGRLEEAEANYDRALALKPDYPEAMTNLACLLRARGRHAEAIALHRETARRWPDYPSVHNNLGVALKDLNRPAEAIAAFRAAVRLKPAYASAHTNLSIALLLAGQFTEGWEEYEWRWRGGLDALVPRSFPRPLWTGQDLSGRTILLHAEQGLGDALQFVRYAAPIAARGARVILEVHPPLKRLLATVPGAAQVIAGGEPLPPFDYHLPLLSAPHLLGTVLETIPADIPYVHPDADLVAAWARRLEGRPGLRVGVVWAGDSRPHDPTSNAIDRRRSMALKRLTPLLSVPGVRFISLQKGTPAGQLNDLAADLRPEDWMDDVTDFADTAALVANLDLVVSVDTSIVHLAGAMGKPVWILSRFDGCWRWLLHRDDSPWYPTARLFRQTEPDNWEEVVARAAADLRNLADRPTAPSSVIDARQQQSTGGTTAPAATKTDADDIAGLFAQAIEHHAAERLDEAEILYLRMLTEHPVAAGHAEAHNNLGFLYRQQGKLAVAAENFLRAIRLRPDYGEAHNNLGLTFSDQGDAEAATACYRRALSLQPADAHALSNLGVALQDLGRTGQAEFAYRRALAIAPLLAGTHYNLAQVLLRQGDYRQGWREHEWLWKGGIERVKPRGFSEPRWTGEDIAGRTILLYGEQGLGDVLQFARYATIVAARGAKVILEVQPQLKRLLGTVPGVAQAVALGDPLPAFDVQLPLMGAPFILGTTVESIPATVPYVTADTVSKKLWKERLASLPGLKVGLVWAGDPRPGDRRAGAVDRRRSISLSRLLPLLSIPEVSFVSLQKGPAATQIADIAPGLRPYDRMEDIGDIADTAAVIDNLDLVISVDTAVAHLAGALGKPVWILSRFDGCWRWLQDREDSPWYPTARLFRQTSPGDWDLVITRLAAALRTQTTCTRPAADLSLSTGDTKTSRSLAPRQAESVGRLFAQAVRYFETDRLNEAAPVYHRILTLDPDHADAMHHLGLIALRSGQLTEAAAWIIKAMVRNPAYPEAYNNLGIIRLEQGDLSQATDMFHRALVLKPDYSTALSNWGSTQGEQGHWNAAEAACRHAVSLEPGFAGAYSNLGVLKSETGFPAEAEVAFRTAILLSNDHAEAHYNLGTTLLSLGRYEEGWPEYEWRLRGDNPEIKPRNFVQPAWTGEPPAGKTILLYAEQGLGDLLQFSRYATLLAAAGARVILETYGQLTRLLTTVPGVAQVVAKGSPLPDFDFHLSVMSAPYRLGTTIDSIPANIPYISPDAGQVEAWGTRLAGISGLKVGLVWAGDPRPHDRRAHAVDRRRSMAATKMLPLLRLPGVTFVSLQKGSPAAQITDIPAELRPYDWMGDVTDFADTAALVANLDLVIAVDTSVVHLVGALGKPIWVLSRFAGCWRWFVDGDESPWYPTARVFRQTTRGDWDEVIGRVVVALQQLTAGQQTQQTLPEITWDSSPAKETLGTEQPPLFVEALRHHQAGRLAEAEQLYRRVLDEHPDHFDSLHHLGLIALWSNDATSAVQWISKAILHNRQHIGAHINLGKALCKMGRVTDAVVVFRMAVALDPEDADNRYHLGACLHDLGALDEAAAAYREALVLRPEFSRALTNLGSALGEQDRLEEAIGVCRWAVAADPRKAHAHTNLGACLHELHRIDEAIASYRQALALSSVLPETHHNLATALLSQGAYAEGWVEYEWRWEGGVAGLVPRQFDSPLWRGEPLAGRTILLHGEQGLGDVLQFARYASVIASCGAKVVLEVYPPLKRLLSTVAGVAQVVATGDPLPAFDCHLPLMSAPLRLGTRLDNIPATVPYVDADPVAVIAWREKLAGLPGLKVGLVWAGDPRTHNPRNNAVDRRRSIPLVRMAPLLATPGVSFVSLQKGEAAAQAGLLAAAQRPFDMMNDVADFADTAALIANLDLVITVDTSVGHLAGAMGKPVWILNRLNGCWRWLDEREDSPWYPTARLFRQTRLGDWDDVIVRVAAALAEWTATASQPTVDALFADAVRHHQENRLDEADSLYRQILAREPRQPVVLHHRGVVAQQRENPRAAVAFIRQSLCLVPSYTEAWSNLGTALRDCGDRAQAEVCFRRAGSLRPDLAEPQNNLAALYKEEGRLDEAIEAFRKALSLQPDHPEIHCNLAAALLERGDYAEGWQEHEWRLHEAVPWAKPKPLPNPVWAGEDLKGRAILLRSEQGLGDDLQFARFATPIANRGARVILEVQASLRRLLASVPGVEQVIAQGEPVPDVDCYLSSMSAPCLLGTTVETIPAQPYVTADAGLAAAWNERLAGLAGLKVGLVWAGDPRPYDRRANAIDRRRSIAAVKMLPLLKTAGVSFISLQKGEAAAQIGEISPGLRPLDLMDEVVDFADTAAIVANLDLVISADTSVVHLAGAMGKPVWVLSRFDGCWRWLTGRDDSPWYPSARLFRQIEPGNWDEVIGRVAKELAKKAADFVVAGPPAIRPAVPEELMAQAVSLHKAGRTADAETLYRRILAFSPDHPFVLHQLGMIRQSLGDADQARQMIERAIAVAPDYAEACNNLGAALADRGKPADAIACCRRAIVLRPDYAKAQSNLGKALKDLGKAADAAIWYQRALVIDPQFTMAFSNLAAALQDMGRLAEAREAGEKALMLAPDHPIALNNHGITLQEQGNELAAISCYERAVRLAPDYAEAHTNLGMAALLHGDYTRGWQEYEWRWNGGITALRQRDFSKPRWTGDDLRGRTILLHAEQGFGDVLQFARYAKPIAARGGKVILEVHPPLMRLLSTVPGVSRVVAMGAPLPEFDCHLPLMSAPLVMGTTERTIPAETPYVVPDAAKVAAWSRRLAGLPGLKVGLVWAGNPRPHDPGSNLVDRRRSMTLQQLMPLLKVPSVSFVNLQKDGPATQIGEISADLRPHDWMAEVADFADTAALIANLDLVISVDTSVVHLAGALGKPVWILSRFNGCWRWLTDREDSPWYPTARLFRQTRRGDWDEVVTRVASALADLTDRTQKPSADAAQLFQQAVEHHQAGRFDEAERLYRSILATEPRNVGCLYHLGLVAQQRGRHADAVDLFQQAVQLNGKVAGLHGSLGTSLAALGRLDDAIASHKRAIALEPELVSAIYNLGNAYLARGNRREASACFQRTAALRPDLAEPYNNLGSIFSAIGAFEAAERSFERAIALQPQVAAGHNNLGNVRKEQGRLAEAEACFQQAISLQPDYVEAHYNLANLRLDMSDIKGAMARFQQVIAVKPTLPEAYNNLGSVLHMNGDVEQAVTCYKRVLTLDPRFPEAHANLGTVYRDRGDIDLAIATYRHAIDLDPTYPLAHTNLAVSLLLRGEFEEGLREFEWRERGGPNGPNREYSQPEWTGEPLAGRTLLLHAEQGLGDTLHFVRYAPILAAKGAKIILEVYPPLVRLLASVPGVSRILATGTELPPHDFHLSLMSVAYRLGTRLDSIPASVPYLAPEPRQVADWARRLARLPGLKVGLVWAGEPRPHDPRAHSVDRRRSMKLEQLSPLLALPGVSFVSLQKGSPARQLDDIPAELRPLDMMEDIADFADTAALVANLDLVISVDTSVAHLTGALAIPIWILSRFDGCWRWLQDREDSPWYPSARLFRQKSPGDWTDVVERVTNALADVIDNPPAPTIPETPS
ncbi:tetratricopeptide repeat protein [Telmatospirillum sp.]|uniref:tetratricopeptide repeat protein n=1 Tax=Telmatospirillum sp. TaxID=2079197 RepID=UPI00283E98A2|nr:tetratricopeptide repeat protein [Telmatospirillum sp.]MDR3438541.1 tetratricopeptide repeat protein [Telmatospirillum sp.]